MQGLMHLAGRDDHEEEEAREMAQRQAGGAAGCIEERVITRPVR